MTSKPTRLSLICALALSVACGDKEPIDSEPTDSQVEDTEAPEDTGPFDSDGDGSYDADDCAPDDPAIHPGADETCDGVDNDCDEAIDEDAVDASTWYTDADGDGYGDDDSAQQACDQPEDTSAKGGDCDDSSADFNPGATENDCTDPNDYNCDGSVGATDKDGDGYFACEECNDADAAINPAATEVCDQVDNDCDQLFDDDDDSLDSSTGSVFYEDDDGDGYGNASVTTMSCEVQEGWADDDTDCDDGDADVNPGESETWYNGVNDDCDADDDCDQDGDGFDVVSEGSCSGGTDCDDTDSGVNTSATDTPQNGVDEDCDGSDAPYAVTDLSSGDLIITEFMPDPKAVNDSVGEWIEIYNNSGGQVDLSGLYLKDDQGGTTFSGSLVFGDGEYVVLANSSSGTVTPDGTYSSSFGLNNDGDSISLYESSSKATLIDSIDYDDFTVIAGASVSLSSDYLDADLSDWPGHYCNGATTFGGSSDQGTPGTANAACSYSYTYDADISSIMGSYCHGCHGSSGGLSLSSGGWGSVAGVSNSGGNHVLVVAFDSTDSYLWAKLNNGTSAITITGSKMPKSGGPLQTSELNAIQTWIDEGAPK